jgi:TolA-binding protein
LRKYETPEEALYDLATRFKREHQRDAWRSTLEYLIERYPNSRYAVRAKEDLAVATE